MKKLLLQSLALPAVQIFFDLAMRALWVSKGGSKWRLAVYLTGLFACWALSFVFVATVSLLRRTGPWPARIAAGAFAVFHTGMLTSNFFMFRFFGEYVFPGSIAFLFDKAYLADYVRTFGGVGPVAALLAIWAAFFLCVRPWGKPSGHPLLILPLLAVVAVTGVMALNSNDKKSEFRMPPDVVGVESLAKHFLRVRDQIWPLRPADRLPVRARTGGPRPSVVLLMIHESMGTRSLAFIEGARMHGGPLGGMPRLANRMRRDSADFFVMQRAYTNAVATQVSMASIFSGVSPEESQRKLHCMPMLWDLAKAAGYKTAYFTSQRLRWATLSDFLLKEPLDTLVSRENTDFPPANDMGIDDFHIVHSIETWLASHPDEPLFIVWNTNAMHVPHQETSEFVDLSQVTGGRYEKALYLLDTALAQVFGALEKSGRMEDALILSTADHGEEPEPTHALARINSYYDEFTRIPLWVRLPRSMRGSAPARALRDRLHTPVANIDLVASLAAYWNLVPDRNAPVSKKSASRSRNKFPEMCSVANGRFPWLGESLFDRNPPTDRVLVALSTNDIRHWDGDGFGLVHGPWRMVLWPDSGRALYNIDTDPQQAHNVLATAPDSVMAPFEQRIKGSRWLNKIYTHHRKRETVEPGNE